MPIHLLSFVVPLASLLAAQLAPHHTIEEIEQRLIEAQKGVQSYIIRQDIVEHHRSRAGMTEVAGTNVYEFSRRGEGFGFRMEQTTESTSDLGGKVKKSTSRLLYAYDGEYLYTFTEYNGEKQARRLKQEVSSPLDAATRFKNLQQEGQLTVLADAKVCGRDCFVIEEVGQGMNAVLGRREVYYCQQTGIILKSIDYNPAGEPFHESTCSELKVNVEVPDSRFQLELPPGVHYDPMTE